MQYWVNNKREWGYCFRVGDGINTNMFVEAFHKSFKYNYLKGKFNKRVDTVLVNLLKFARDKTFGRLIKLTKGKSTQRIRIRMTQNYQNFRRLTVEDGGTKNKQ